MPEPNEEAPERPGAEPGRRGIEPEHRPGAERPGAERPGAGPEPFGNGPEPYGAAAPEPHEGPGAAEGPEPSGLSARELAVLGVERQGWAGPGAKERAVREQLGISPTRYYQLLNALLDDARAVAHDPVTVNRLRRIRDERRARR